MRGSWYIWCIVLTGLAFPAGIHPLGFLLGRLILLRLRLESWDIYWNSLPRLSVFNITYIDV